MKTTTLVLLGLFILSVVINSISFLSEYLLVLTLASGVIYLISGGPSDYVHQNMDRGEMFACIFLTIIFTAVCTAVLNGLIPKEWFTDVKIDRMAYASERFWNFFASILISLALGVLTFNKGWIERCKRVDID